MLLKIQPLGNCFLELSSYIKTFAFQNSYRRLFSNTYLPISVRTFQGNILKITKNRKEWRYNFLAQCLFEHATEEALPGIESCV